MTSVLPRGAAALSTRLMLAADRQEHVPEVAVRHVLSETLDCLRTLWRLADLVVNMHPELARQLRSVASALASEASDALGGEPRP